MPPDDGIVEVPVPVTEVEKMPAADLPDAVAGHLITESVGNIQANNRDGRNIGTVAMGVLQGAMARNFDELGTVEGRAVSGVNSTPLGPPSAQG